jgi:hypothetical protein
MILYTIYSAIRSFHLRVLEQSARKPFLVVDVCQFSSTSLFSLLRIVYRAELISNLPKCPRRPDKR